MRGPDPDEVFAWLLDTFGGSRQKLKGRNDAVRSDVDGFSPVWFLVQKGEAAPTPRVPRPWRVHGWGA